MNKTGGPKGFTFWLIAISASRLGHDYDEQFKQKTSKWQLHQPHPCFHLVCNFTLHLNTWMVFGFAKGFLNLKE